MCWVSRAHQLTVAAAAEKSYHNTRIYWSVCTTFCRAFDSDVSIWSVCQSPSRNVVSPSRLACPTVLHFSLSLSRWIRVCVGIPNAINVHADYCLTWPETNRFEIYISFNCFEPVCPSSVLNLGEFDFYPIDSGKLIERKHPWALSFSINVHPKHQPNNWLRMEFV